MIKYPSSSLLISTYNWPEALELVLRSAGRQEEKPDEIVIADDGSRSDTEQLIAAFRNKISIPVKHVWHEDDGFRKTIILNKAVNEITGEYIIQIDGDIIMHPKFVSDHLRHAKKGHFVKGSRALLTADRTAQVLKSKDININSFQKGVKSAINGTRFPMLAPLFYGDPENSGNTKGCNFAFWKKDFIAINGYNNDMKGWGHEDIEIAARFVNNGIKRQHLKMTAVAFHLHHNSSNENLSGQNRNQNLDIYNEVVKNKITTCSNGFQQTADSL